MQYFWNIDDPIARVGAFLSWLEGQPDADRRRMTVTGVFSDRGANAEVVLRVALETWLHTTPGGAAALEAIHSRIELSRWPAEVEIAARLAAEAFLTLDRDLPAAALFTAPFSTEPVRS